ncbi:MerR family transcriptional regulator [Brevibacillus choshinensis]|uniref:MerR family transcriptional regulator n=1 Tax=Brevibacillus choshinensis TaxID=54911 RepID=A0ABX7FXB5_BRECH|nr:MerR family transcriptional regulator [Brevibacillus choshinensis]QRG70445.1 MerR family transcriptional regulator [Brevibacillus choshinensis]
MHISELSRRTGVSLRSLRYYEEKELLRPSRQENGYRDFDESDIERVRIIQLYFSLGLKTSDILSFFDCAFGEEIKQECLPNAIRVGERKLEEIKQQIETLRKAESLLEENLASWRKIMHEGDGLNES